MDKYPNSEKAALNLLRNRVEVGNKMGVAELPYTPPSTHYPHKYKWDIIFAAITFARAGKREWVDKSKTEFASLFEGQRGDGFIPNMQFATKGRELDPERLFAFDKSAVGSNYTQPAVEAIGVAEVYKAISELADVESFAALEEADIFLDSVYEPLKKSYDFLSTHRSNGSDDKLIGVIHPHETGRDSDPTFDFIKPMRLKRKGPETSRLVDIANVPIDYLSIIAHGIKLRKAGGNIAQSKEIFWVNDVMMNCIYADNLYEMASLAEATHNIEDNLHFSNLAEAVEQQIITKMWFPGAREGQGAFYALNKDGSPIEEISVSNLFPLTLPNISDVQLESLLNLMDSSFDAPYPLPSVATDSSNYDPHNREIDRLWRGPTWINTNWYVVERGLKTQINKSGLSHRTDLMERCLEWERKIVQSSVRLLDMNGPCEHYDPISGEGQRNRVKNFAWSNLGYVMLQSS